MMNQFVPLKSFEFVLGENPAALLQTAVTSRSFQGLMEDVDGHCEACNEVSAIARCGRLGIRFHPAININPQYVWIPISV